MQAQTKTPAAVGEYYLQGVMETASGFRLNQDGSFNFFFSYGAMDREGSGNWKQEGDSIIFNSLQKPNTDYTLLQSKKINGAGIAVHIISGNTYFTKMVHAVMRYGSTEEQASADAEGLILFSSAVADSITLLFEWCPEKKYTFIVPDKSPNYFEFQLEPSIMDVVFNNFRLKADEEGLTGSHPLMETKSFRFKRAR